jgi:hypothetical protein
MPLSSSPHILTVPSADKDMIGRIRPANASDLLQGTGTVPLASRLVLPISSSFYLQSSGPAILS